MKRYLCILLLLLAINNTRSQTVAGVKVLDSYPINAAQNVHPSTGIGVTFSKPIRAGSIVSDSVEVFGKSGIRYSGTVKISRNRQTVIFTPSNSLPLGESITARFGPFETIDDEKILPYSISFTVRTTLVFPDSNIHSDDPVLEHQLHNTFHDGAGKSNRLLNFPTSPETFPIMQIIEENNPSDGYMYLTNYKYTSEQSNTFRMILDKYGDIIDAQGGGPDYFGDFKPYPDGTYSFYDYFNEAFFILDSNFSLEKTIGSTYGYVTDAHEIRKTSDGNYYIIAADYEFIDMSQWVKGGWNTATVLVPIIQEFDQDSNLIFEWRTIDHFKVTDATHEDLTVSYIDYCHINAIEFDADSNLLISCRHMDEITKIDRQTGEIMWRWGGNNNQFAFLGDTIQFSHQHAIRRTDAGTYTMFDNGNFHTGTVAFSRAVEYRLDQQNKTATKVWEFRHSPDILSLSMGYVQRLPNQHTFIGWGECDYATVTEVDPKNRTLYEVAMTEGNYSYRAYKYDTNYVRGKTALAIAASGGSPDIVLTCLPNPVTYQAQVLFSATEFTNIHLSLYDALGREVSQIYEGDLSAGEHSFVLNSKNLPAGIYHIKANRSDGPSLNKKIIIEK